MIFTSYANLLNASTVFKANGLPNTTKPFFFEVADIELMESPKAIADILFQKLQDHVRDGTRKGEDAWAEVVTAITDPVQRTIINAGSWHIPFIRAAANAVL